MPPQAAHLSIGAEARRWPKRWWSVSRHHLDAGVAFGQIWHWPPLGQVAIESRPCRVCDALAADVDLASL